MTRTSADKPQLYLTAEDQQIAQAILAVLEPVLGKLNYTQLFRIALRALAARERVMIPANYPAKGLPVQNGAK